MGCWTARHRPMLSKCLKPWRSVWIGRQTLEGISALATGLHFRWLVEGVIWSRLRWVDQNLHLLVSENPLAPAQVLGLSTY